jgi:Holliday junction resolvase
MKNTKAAGTKRELQVVKQYRDDGWVAFRTPASFGVCDVVAMKRQAIVSDSYLHPVTSERIRLLGPLTLAAVHMVEVKANHGGPFMNFRQPEREALREAAARAGAQAILCHWPPGGERRDIPSDEWPESRKAAA